MRISSVSCVSSQKGFNLNTKKINSNSHLKSQNPNQTLEANTVNFKGNDGKLFGSIIGTLAGEIISVAAFGPLGILGLAGTSILGGFLGGGTGYAVGDIAEDIKNDKKNNNDN